MSPAQLVKKSTALRFSVLLCLALPKVVFARPLPTPQLDIAYGQGTKQKLDLYFANPSAPLLVFIHGGAWVSGDKADYQFFARSFQSAGISAAIINYRLSPDGEDPHPAALNDAAAAVSWLLASPRLKDGQRTKVFLMGHSAGAFMLGWLAHSQTDSRIKGFIGLEGIYDLPDLAKRWPTYPDWFLKKAFGADPAKWASDSPANVSTVNSSPWLLVHSADDELVDQGQTNRFAQKLVASKLKVELLHPTGLSHFGVVEQSGLAGSELFQRILNFVLVR